MNNPKENKTEATKKAIFLHFINGFYVLLGAIMIGTAAGAYVAFRDETRMHLGILIGIVVLGVFLMMEAVTGIVATLLRSQCGLLLYMVLLVLQFLFQFSVSVAALSMSGHDQMQLLICGWNKLSENEQDYVQNRIDCCGFGGVNSTHEDGHPNWEKYGCGDPQNKALESEACMVNTTATACYTVMKSAVDTGVKDGAAGCLGFSFIALFGIVVAYYYRKSISRDRDMYGTVLNEELL
eukprot:m.15539 g.15539  ORF g.15539 m.15539 type:complete len:238 (+) comp5424_c0_seq2:273-986(+)